MPKFKVVRRKPGGGGGITKLQERVIELEESASAPAGSEPVANDTPTTDWTDASASPIQGVE